MMRIARVLNRIFVAIVLAIVYVPVIGLSALIRRILHRHSKKASYWIVTRHTPLGEDPHSAL